MSRSLLALGAAAAAVCLSLPACQPQKRGESRAEFTRNVDRTIDGTGVRTLSLETGPGTLRVIGEAGRKVIAIEGLLFAEAESFAEAKRIAGEVELNAISERTENPVVKVTEPRLAKAGQVHTLDLTVRVPTSVLVVVVDSAGDVDVSGLGAGTRLVCASGKVTVAGVRGGVEVRTKGTSTEVRDSSGRIEVHDGPGDIEISGISGDIHVSDTDGKLAIRNVSGSVTASDNPTGAIVQNVEGDVTLIRISPSSSQIQGVGGTLSYPTGSQ
jgi:DUF4097 and DUF4098 domain-containing protein YvlB